MNYLGQAQEWIENEPASSTPSTVAEFAAACALIAIAERLDRIAAALEAQQAQAQKPEPGTGDATIAP